MLAQYLTVFCYLKKVEKKFPKSTLEVSGKKFSLSSSPYHLQHP